MAPDTRVVNSSNVLFLLFSSFFFFFMKLANYIHIFRTSKQHSMLYIVFSIPIQITDGVIAN